MKSGEESGVRMTDRMAVKRGRSVYSGVLSCCWLAGGRSRIGVCGNSAPYEYGLTIIGRPLIPNESQSYHNRFSTMLLMIDDDVDVSMAVEKQDFTSSSRSSPFGLHDD